MATKNISRVLAIETSCDDTSVAIVTDQAWVESCVSANQDLAHAPFGGVVPEIASRNHTLQILPLIEDALAQAKRNWTDIDALAVTSRPGLLGALIVGVMTAKTLAQVRGLPWLGVNHLEGHILAPFLRDEGYAPPASFAPPFLALAVSGGHTSIYLVHDFGRYETLGTTLDDAAGEAFDKFGKMLGLGFPGGAQVDKLSIGGDPQAFAFPRGLLHEDNLAMSFSGLKASAQRLVASLPPETLEVRKKDLCASFQAAVTEVLISKLDRAYQRTKIKNIVITGGVSANSGLRLRGQEWAKAKGLSLVIPPLRYCTDNAAMIGWAGIRRMKLGEFSNLQTGPSPQALDADFMPGSA